MSVRKKAAARIRTGRFQPGQSGNPAGRPRGSRNERTIFLHSLLDGEGEAILRKLVKLAIAGEPQALKLATERLLPARTARDRSVELQLPNCKTASEVSQACGDVLQMATCGEISLEAATALVKLLELQRRTIETSDLAERLLALERGGSPEATEELERMRRRREEQD
jgi:hypothetical protein